MQLIYDFRSLVFKVLFVLGGQDDKRSVGSNFNVQYHLYGT